MSESKTTAILSEMQEGLTGFIGQINSDHAYIHDGIGYEAIINTGSISAAYDIAFTTPAIEDGVIHWRPADIYTSSNFVTFELYEGDSYSSGSSVTPVNKNRIIKDNSNFNSKITTMVKGATATPTGTLIQHFGIGSTGNPASRSGGGAASAEEIVLAPSTDYVITLTPAGATLVLLTLFWYEESKGFDEK